MGRNSLGFQPLAMNQGRSEISKKSQDYIRNAKAGIYSREVSINYEYAELLHRLTTFRFAITNSPFIKLSILIISIPLWRLFSILYFKWKFVECIVQQNEQMTETEEAVLLHDCQKYFSNINEITNIFFEGMDFQGLEIQNEDIFVLIVKVVQFQTIAHIFLCLLINFKAIQKNLYTVRMRSVRTQVVKRFPKKEGIIFGICLLISLIFHGGLKFAINTLRFSTVVSQHSILIVYSIETEHSLLKIIKDYILIYAFFGFAFFNYYTDSWQNYVHLGKYQEGTRKLIHDDDIENMHFEMDFEWMWLVRTYYEDYKDEKNEIILLAVMTHLLDEGAIHRLKNNYYFELEHF